MAKQPSLRARKTAKILAENGFKSVSSAMRQAGYSKVTAAKPSKLTSQKTWQELMDEYIPRDLVAKTHKDLFEAEETIFIQQKGKIIEKKRADFTARKNATEMAYKLRGDYAPEQLEVKRKYSELSNAELVELVNKAKSKLMKK